MLIFSFAVTSRVKDSHYLRQSKRTFWPWLNRGILRLSSRDWLRRCIKSISWLKIQINQWLRKTQVPWKELVTPGRLANQEEEPMNRKSAKAPRERGRTPSLKIHMRNRKETVMRAHRSIRQRQTTHRRISKFWNRLRERTTLKTRITITKTLQAFGTERSSVSSPWFLISQEQQRSKLSVNVTSQP